MHPSVLRLVQAGLVAQLQGETPLSGVQLAQVLPSKTLLAEFHSVLRPSVVMPVNAAHLAAQIEWLNASFWRAQLRHRLRATFFCQALQALCLALLQWEMPPRGVR